MVCVLGCFQVGRLFVHVRLLAALPVVLRHSGNVLLFCLFVSIFVLSRYEFLSNITKDYVREDVVLILFCLSSKS